MFWTSHSSRAVHCRAEGMRGAGMERGGSALWRGTSAAGPWRDLESPLTLLLLSSPRAASPWPTLHAIHRGQREALPPPSSNSSLGDPHRRSRACGEGT